MKTLLFALLVTVSAANPLTNYFQVQGAKFDALAATYLERPDLDSRLSFAYYVYFAARAEQAFDDAAVTVDDLKTALLNESFRARMFAGLYRLMLDSDENFLNFVYWTARGDQLESDSDAANPLNIPNDK